MAGEYFSVTAMFVMFRECAEAAVILAVLLGFLAKVKKEHLKNQVWIGAACGLFASLLFAVVFIIIYYTLNKDVFHGKAEAIFEGCLSVLACVVMTVLGFGMLKMMALEKKWQRKLNKLAEQEMERGYKKYTFFLIAFTAVLREGIESTLFLAGVGTDTPWKAIPIGGFVGICLGLLLGVFIFYGMKPVQLRWFFYISTVILLFVAAGLLRQGIAEFQEAGAFGSFKAVEGVENEEDEDSSTAALSLAALNGTTPDGSGVAEDEEEEEDEIGWQNKPLWNICECCPNTDQGFFELAKALVGYTCAPTFIELVFYVFYWLVVLCIFLFKWKRGTLLDYPEDEDEQQEALDEEAAVKKPVVAMAPTLRENEAMAPAEENGVAGVAER